MDGAGHFTIGELARRSGLPVRTIRFYSNAGVVPPSGRSAAGYRLCDVEALARLETARTLRDLGLDLETVTRVLDRKVTLGDVVALHADALDAQIRKLRLRRAVLRAVAKHNTTPETMELMHNLAKLSEEERTASSATSTTRTSAASTSPRSSRRACARSGPRCPTTRRPIRWRRGSSWPSWSRSRGSVNGVREMSEPIPPSGGPAKRWRRRPETGSSWWWRSTPARPGLPASTPGRRKPQPPWCRSSTPYRVTRLTPELRAATAERFAMGNDGRVERYRQLLGTVKGWHPFRSMTPAFTWTIEALRAHPRP